MSYNGPIPETTCPCGAGGGVGHTLSCAHNPAYAQVEEPAAPEVEEEFDSIFTEYTRVPFTVDAAQVTKDNMEALAVLAGGACVNGSYIKLDIKTAHSERQTKAYVGDWILRMGESYKAYTKTAFERNFLLIKPLGPNVQMFLDMTQRYIETANDFDLSMVVYKEMPTANNPIGRLRFEAERMSA